MHFICKQNGNKCKTWTQHRQSDVIIIKWLCESHSFSTFILHLDKLTKRVCHLFRYHYFFLWSVSSGVSLHIFVAKLSIKISKTRKIIAICIANGRSNKKWNEMNWRIVSNCDPFYVWNGQTFFHFFRIAFFFCRWFPFIIFNWTRSDLVNFHFVQSKVVHFISVSRPGGGSQIGTSDISSDAAVEKKIITVINDSPMNESKKDFCFGSPPCFLSTRQSEMKASLYIFRLSFYFLEPMCSQLWRRIAEEEAEEKPN